MNQSISVSYTTQGERYEVPLVYRIDKEAGILTVSCAVNMTTAIPSWLQIRKFEVTAQLQQGRYCALYNANNDSRNIDCSLFIDKAYAAIMHCEKLNVAVGKAV
ncbi:MAG TPA: hypothetical protein VL093_11840 [Flavipsychrobacter sp.]|nr:hypothetical protein [Flavipsychrobacter sp.]